jgi:hypothetical protein
MEELLAALAAYDTVPAFEGGRLRLRFPPETPPPPDLVAEARTNQVELGATLYPTDWRPVTELPDLRNVGLVALDLETRDGGIAAGIGAAWPWGDGHICGVSVGYRKEGNICSHYFPIRHPASNNFDSEQVFRWLRDHVGAGVRFVTQNGLYDWGWLRSEAGMKMPPAAQLEEIGALATIVDENQLRFGLNALCAWRGIPGKDEAGLKEAAVVLGLIRAKARAVRTQSLIWQMPAHCVGAYAEADAAATLALFENLNPILDKEGTRNAYRLEVDILPLVQEMRLRGVRVDQSAAEQLRDRWAAERDAALRDLSGHLGAQVGMDELNRSKWLEATCDAHRIEYPYTKEGNPSFTGGKRGWMAKHPHWLPQLVDRANKYDEATTKFLDNYILGHLIAGRIYANINPHRGEYGEGARTTRFSYSEPPLQQMPKRDKELGPEIRRCFLPEDGERWVTLDASEQEFRLIVHFAELNGYRGAKEAGDRYHNDPKASFHAMVMEMTGLPKDNAKTISFGKIYGMGLNTMALELGKSTEEARALVEDYNRKLPFILELDEECKKRASERGYIKLYDGARRHWPFAAVGGKGECTLDEAQRRIGDLEHPWHGCALEPVRLYRALNSLIQGSAARHTKLWMRAVWQAGIVPLLQMHDALECSVSAPEQAERIRQFGQEAVKLTVPMLIAVHYGPTWGDATNEEWK